MDTNKISHGLHEYRHTTYRARRVFAPDEEIQEETHAKHHSWVKHGRLEATQVNTDNSFDAIIQSPTVGELFIRTSIFDTKLILPTPLIDDVEGYQVQMAVTRPPSSLLRY